MTPYEKLDALYAELPTMNCQRKCQSCCGPILIPKIEVARLEEKRGMLLTSSDFEPVVRADLPDPEVVLKEFLGLVPEKGTLDCVFLAPPPFGHCQVYSIRPLICRLWGMCDHPTLRCPHGCVPSRWLDMHEVKSWLLRIIEIQQEARNSVK